MLRARQPLPCTPWLSGSFTKPRHSNRCTRVVPTQGWCRSCARRLTSLYERRKSQRGPSRRRCPPWWSRSAISGSTWQRWRTLTRHAFSMPPSPEDFALQFSAVRQQAEAIQHILPRRAAPSTAAPGARPQSARRRGRPPAASRVAPPQAESTHRPVRRASRRRAAPPASQPGPKSSRKLTKRAWSGQPGYVGVCSFSGDGENSAAPSPGGGPGGESCFSFYSVPPLVQGPAVPTFSKKETFPFPPGSQVHGTTVCDALLPHSRPRPIFAERVPREQPREYSSGTMNLPTHLWPVPFGTQGVRWGTPQNAPPSVPSTPTPFRCTTTGTSIVPLEPLALRLAAWLTLPSLSRWFTRTIRLGYAIQFARRPPKFNGVHETSVSVRNAPILREEIVVLLAKDAIELVPPAEMRQGFHSPYFIVPKKGGQQPILDRRVLNRALHKLPFKMLTHYQMHPAPGLVCSDRPEGRLHSCYDPSVTQTVPTVWVRGSGMVVQGPPPWTLPVSPCLYKDRRGRPYPATGSGRQGPQLPQRLAYLGPIQRAVVRSKRLGASAPQPVGASGQLGKEQALPCAENLFSRSGVGGGTALGGGRASLSVAVSRKSIAHIRGLHPEHSEALSSSLSAEREGCLQTEVGPLDSGGRRLGVPVSRRAVPPGGEGSLHSECCLLLCVGARRLSGGHLQELWAGRHRTPSQDSTVSALSQFLPVCWVTGNGREELAGVTLAAPFPLTRGYEHLFLLQFSSPDGEPWWNPPSTPSSQTGRSSLTPGPVLVLAHPGLRSAPVLG